ncbi:MAG: DNA-processing protein DprA [Bacteroidetes bacterium]|nr:DNA-processing protein DprA [Bacteroidota bacterium]
MNQNRFEILAKLQLLLSIERVGPSRIINLYNKYNGIDEIYNSSYSSLLTVNSINTHIAKSILLSKNRIAESYAKLEIEIKKLNAIGARIISFLDDDYPEYLKKIFSPPIILYVKGTIPNDGKNSIAIVGTRRPTDYGKLQAKQFSENLTMQNITIISGLARGVDSIAHKACLNHNGKTIAVTGSGLDVVYPPENKKLYEEIAASGAIISEFELGTKPDAQNFPRRNRIISGLSAGTLIIETGITGGAMQTAAHALDQNREVFAIPGNLGITQTEGINRLIQRGEAKLVTNVEDILVELNLSVKSVDETGTKQGYEDLNLFEESILLKLTNKPIQIDELADELKMSSTECLVYLLSLELKGYARQLPGKNFILSR